MLSQTQVQLLSSKFPNLNFKKNEPLSSHTYFKIGGPADLFFTATSVKELQELSSFCSKERIPFLVLGGGSNVLVSDEGIHKLVIENKAEDIQIVEHEQGAKVTISSGSNMNMVVRKTIDRGLAGFEKFMGLPGTFGGAIVNNAHFKDELVGNVVDTVTVLDKNGNEKQYKKEECEFGYDSSIFQKTHEVILFVVCSLKKADSKILQEEAIAATKKRAITQPIGLPSSGCMFKNPTVNGITQYAGYLIEQSGLKGYSIGDASVSEKHANFIINKGNATSKDVDELAKHIQDTVKEKFNTQLEREVFSIN